MSAVAERISRPKAKPTKTAAAARHAAQPREVVMSAKERHEQRKAWFVAEAAKQGPNRARMAKCENAYDSEQWSREDAADVEARGQNPVVYNEIKPAIDWMIGTERRSRVDFYVVAEEDGQEAEDDATNKTKLLKYLDDTNRAGFERSYAAEDMFKAGVGWLEVGLRGDRTGVPIFVGAESWRNILWDSNDRRRDLSNARYLFRIKIVDFDVALAIFPDKREELERCVQEGDELSVFTSWMSGSGLISGLDAFGANSDEIDFITPKPVGLFNPRKRVMLLECWSREPQRRPTSDDGLGDPVTFKMRVSIMTEHDTLIESWSPFNHDQFPFIPLWAYINRRTGLPYSPILPMLGPQEALNHRMSKAIMEAASNQFMVEEDALSEAMDMEELREELNAPDGIMVFKSGALNGNRVRERPTGGAATQQLVLAERDKTQMRSASGVTADNRGEQSNVVSGKAVIAKAEQGGLLTAELFDNLLLARQIEGELTLSMAEQFVKAPMTIRVAGEGRKVERTRINQPQADGTYLNDITARRAHFTVGEQAWKQSYAESAFASLMEVLTQLAAAAPQVVVNLLDLVFDMHPNLPRKKALMDRIRAVNGQQDPDGKLTPDQQLAQEQMAEQAKAQYEATMAKIQADIQEAVAKGEKLVADAMKSRLESLYISAQAAQTLAQMPGAVPMADELLRSAGFKDAGATGEVIPPDVVPETQPAAPVEQVPVDPSLGPQPPADGSTAAPLMGEGEAAGIETVAPDGVIQPGD
ncbi:MAG TPA: hypothetical protein VGE36_13705 [Roseateles sp.]